MTVPETPALSPEQVLRLKRYMTVGGYDLAAQQFGLEGIMDALSSTGDLRLAAAELLEGLPSAAEAGALKRFKLDVLEFEYAAGKAVSTDWAALAQRLRAQVGGGGGGTSANPAPLLEPWGIG